MGGNGKSKYSQSRTMSCRSEWRLLASRLLGRGCWAPQRKPHKAAKSTATLASHGPCPATLSKRSPVPLRPSSLRANIYPVRWSQGPRRLHVSCKPQCEGRAVDHPCSRPYPRDSPGQPSSLTAFPLCPLPWHSGQGSLKEAETGLIPSGSREDAAGGFSAVKSLLCPV